MEIDDNSLSDILQDPMTLKKDNSFVAYLPLLRDNQVMYSPSTIYCFMRFFYDIYERLLKAKSAKTKNFKKSNLAGINLKKTWKMSIWPF